MIETLYIILVTLTLLVALCIILPLWEKRHDTENSPPGILVGVIIISLLFTSGFGLYQLWGNAPILQQIKERSEKLAYVKGSVDTLMQDIADEPQNTMLWLQLGLAHIELANYSKAALAFREATLLSGGGPMTLLLYAKALTLEAHGIVTPGASKALSMVLLQDPENIEAQYFKAVESRQQGDLETARSILTKLQQNSNNTHPFRPMIENAISEIAEQ